MEQRSYYAVIPADVRYDQDLQPNAKLLYGEITALCNDKGYCWASNKYFADLYGVSNRCVINWINSLIDKKYVYKEICYQGDSKVVEKRLLTLNPSEEKFTRVGKKVHYPSEENFTGGGEKKFTDNNTIINNAFNNKKNIKKQTKKDVLQVVYDLQISDDLKEALVGFVEMRKQIDKERKIMEKEKLKKEKKANLSEDDCSELAKRKYNKSSKKINIKLDFSDKENCDLNRMNKNNVNNGNQQTDVQANSKCMIF